MGMHANAYTQAVLTKQIAAAKLKFSEVSEDLEFVQKNYVIAEVNMSRVFNWDVKRRREEKAASDAGKENGAAQTNGNAGVEAKS